MYTFHVLVNRYAVMNKCSQNKPRYPLGSRIVIYLVDSVIQARHDGMYSLQVYKLRYQVYQVLDPIPRLLHPEETYLQKVAK